MDLANRVIDLFHQHIESCMYTMESVSENIARAGQLIVEALLSERKLICCGEGSQGLIAQHMATNMLNCYQHERPALPAIALSNDTATATAIAAQFGYNDIYANQIRALGQGGDCLFLAYQGTGNANILRCIQAAHERDMRIIALSNTSGGDASSLLQPEDVELAFPVESRARLTEMQLIAVHGICDIIDQQLFGHDDPCQ